MKYKVKCPYCDGDAGIISIIFALTPFSFQCFNCKSRIKVKGIFKLMALNFILMGVIAIIFMRVLFDMGVMHNQQYIYLLGPAFVIMLMEFIRGLLVCNKAKLVCNKKKKKSEDS